MSIKRDTTEGASDIKDKYVDDSPVDEAQQINEALTSEKREARRLESRPSIDHLVDAVVRSNDGKLTFVPIVGQKVVVERVSTVTKNRPWLDTRVWVVNRVNAETGRVDLWCEDLNQNGVCNFITGTNVGYRFKLVPAKGPVFARKHNIDMKDDK